MRSANDRSDFQAKVQNMVRMSRAMAGAGSPAVPHAPGRVRDDHRIAVARQRIVR
jgi:hypothetical protein